VDLNNLGKKIRILRLKRGLTLEEVGQRTGINKASLSYIENGRRKVTLEVMARLSRIYPWRDLVNYLLLREDDDL
jgi:transcriptional regulator with XRE-family HTH domain